MSPNALRRQWRQGSGSALARRRGVAGLALLSAGSMGVIALYQLGLIKHLPDPPAPGVDSEAVVGSDEAYARLDVPDAVLGLASYAVTLGLATAGGADRVPAALAPAGAGDQSDNRRRPGGPAGTRSVAEAPSASAPGAFWPPVPPSPRCRSPRRR